MRPLALAALAWALAGGAVRAEAPKATLPDAVLSFRTAQESNITPELLQEALAEIVRQQSAQGAVPDSEPEPPDVAVEARKSFNRLIAHFMGKRRSGVNRYVSERYRGDRGALDDDMAETFRNFPIIRLAVDIYDVNVVDDMALVHFHYNLALVSSTGAESVFRGETRMRFVMEDGRAMLIQQDQPQLIGFALPNSENPKTVSQGPATNTGSVGPACPTPVSGTVTMEDNNQGFLFSQQRVISPPPLTGADFFKAGATLRSFNGSGMKSLGFGPLNDVTELTSGGFSGNLPISVGQRVGFRTGLRRAAIIRIVSFDVDAMGTPIMTFQYKAQQADGFGPNGVRCFK